MYDFENFPEPDVSYAQTIDGSNWTTPSEDDKNNNDNQVKLFQLHE